MSFDSEYLKLRAKRKKKEQEETTNSTNNNFGYNKLAEKLSSSATSKRSVTQNLLDKDLDIAPIKSTVGTVSSGVAMTPFESGIHRATRAEREKEFSKLQLFQKSKFFEDGYDVGDVSGTILTTGLDLGLDVVKGIGRLAEGVGDAIDYGIAGISDLVGADDFAEELRKSTQKSLVDDWTKGADEYLEPYSVSGRTLDAVGEGVGQALGMYATGGLGGAIGLGAKGVTALTTGTTLVSGFGSGTSEAYQNGATDEEAHLYGAISGSTEAITELMFGGMGKGVKALGLSHGLSSADDMVAKKVGDMFTDQIMSNFAEFGIKATAEGFEEVVAGTLQAVGKKMTYMSEEEFADILKDENLLESFVVGTVSSGFMQSGVVPGTSQGSLKEANQNVTDFVSGLDVNEQAVVDTVVESRIAEAEKDGTKLSRKDKSKIEEEVLADLEKGEISIDTIESVLGGETYEQYKSAKEKDDALVKEYEELGNKVNATLKEQTRYKELEELYKKFENNSQSAKLKAQLGEEVFNLTKGSKLTSSYVERGKRGQVFEADLSQYDDKQKAIVQKAIDSGVLNNTRRTHEFVDMLAKISADKGVDFDFVNNKKLKESSFAVEGRTVNGYRDGNTIGVNIDSKNSLRTVVGHEITHVLEGTEVYDALADVVEQYATTKGEYTKRMDALREVYKGVYENDGDFDAKIRQELTADIVGEYLFTDTDFINSLSTKQPNLFKKIYNEIKYLCKVATAGSKEARELEKVKRAFDKAYKESGTAQKNAAENSGVNFSLSGINKDGIEVYETSQATMDLTWNERKAKYLDVMKNEYRGRTARFERNGHIYYAEFDRDSIRKHIYGDDRSSPKGTKALIKAGADGDVFDLVENSTYRRSKKNTKDHTDADYFDYFVKTVQIDGKVFDLVADVEKKYGADGGYVYTLALTDNKKIKASPSHETSNEVSVKNEGNTFIDDILPQYSEKSSENVKYSLTAETESKYNEAVKNKDIKTAQKIVDEVAKNEGYSIKAYHGGDKFFTVFGKGNKTSQAPDGAYFFSSNKDVAYSYTAYKRDVNTDVNSYPVYEQLTREGTFEKNRVAKGGVYSTYLKMQNPYIVDFGGEYYSHKINGMDINETVKFAMENGYDGVIAKNIKDPGDMGDVNYESKNTLAVADDYIVFDSSQIKTAEPITYDDKGNVISLSERFKKDNADIRYSISKDSEGENLTDGQKEYFKDSKIVDRDGNLLKVYHTTNNDFTVFDKARKGEATEDANTYLGFFFTDDAEYMQNFPEFEGGKTESYYLNMKNPIDMTNISREAFMDIVEVMGGDVGDASILFDEELEDAYKRAKLRGDNNVSLQLGHLLDELTGEFYYDDFIRELQPHYDNLMSKGYDGVINYMDELFGVKEYIVLDSHQAKLTSNTNPTADADVRYSLSDSEGRELSKEQQDYFKDSKARDENGNLKVVYHGTRNANFTVFKRNQNYFTDSRDVADSYSPNGETFEGYLNIKKPYEVDALGEKWSKIPIDAETKEFVQGYGGSVFKEGGKWRTTPADIVSAVQDAIDDGEMDYDGVIIKNIDDTGSYYKGKDKHIATDYIVFNSNQFKKTDNKKPTTDPDIRYSLSMEDDAPTRKRGEIYGDDVRLVEDIAPVQETVAEESLNDIPIDYAPMTEDEANAMVEEQNNIATLTDDDVPPEFDAPIYDMGDTTSIDDTTLKGIAQRLGDTLSLTTKETKAIQEVVQKYSTTEFPDSEILFKEIKDKFGEKTWTERNEDIADIKMIMKGFHIKVSDAIKNDIADYGQWQRSNFGKLKFSKDGLTVDDIYEGMSQSYPHFFPADIVNPTDQLLKMAEVVNLDTNTTESYELDDDTIQQATDIVIDEVNKYKESSLVQGLRDEQSHFYKSKAEEETGKRSTVKTVKERLEEKLKNTRAELLMNQQLRDDSVADFEKEISRLQAEYNAKRDKNTKAANNILRRIERLQRMKGNVDADYSKRISDIESRIEKMDSKQYQTAEQRKSKQQEYSEQMAELVGDTSTWKDKKLGISYKVNTLRRNLRDIVRDETGKKDIAKADAIYDELQGKYNHNEAELNRESNQIKQPYAKMKITDAESTYIQMLGELRHNPDTTLTEDVVKEFYEKHKNKIDTEKVDKAIEMARETFDELLVRVNQVLSEQGMKEIPYRKGYFPHFTEEKQGFLAKLFNWKTQNNDIPTDIAGLTENFNPNRSWQSFNKQRKGDTTDYNFLKGLDTYVQGSLDWIHHIEDIQKRRAFENHIRYVHSEKGTQEKIDAIRNNEEYDAEEMQEQIDLVYKEAGNPLNNFVTDFRTATNTLAGKKSSIDRSVEEMTNRKFYSTMTNISNRVNGNMVVGSISSALTNFIPITQSWGEVSPVSSLRAMGDTIISTFRDDGTVNKSDFLTNRLRQADKLYQTKWDKISEKVSILMEGIDSFTSQTVWRSKYLENISKGMSENEAIKNADQFAENVIAGRSRGNQPTIFDSKNPLIKMFTAFQLEVNNQYGYMFKDMPQDMQNESKAKLVKGYAEMFIGAYIYNALYSSLTGRNAAFDPIKIIQDLLANMGFGGDDEEDEEIAPSKVAMDFADDILEELPFVSGLVGGGRNPISSAMPYGEGVYEMVEGTLTDIESGDTEKLTKEWLNPLFYLVAPVGGGQAKKTYQGLSMFNKEKAVAGVTGSYTDSGSLRFPVEDTVGNRVKAGLFGQYAFDNAREYFDNEYAPLKEKQIQEYADVDLPIADYWKYREDIKELDSLEEKFDYIADMDLPVEKKNILINNIVDRKDDVDLENYDDFSGYEEFDFYTKNTEKYEFLESQGVSYEEYKADEDAKKEYDNIYSWYKNNPEKVTVSKAVTDNVIEYRGYTSVLNDIRADKDENGKSISGSAKEKKAEYISGLDIDDGAKYILFRSQYKSDDTYNYEIVEYLDSREDISWEEMVIILEELNFKVYSDGTIEWD